MKEMNKNRLLVVVDMQNDFTTGTLGTEEAKTIVPNVIKKIHQYMDRLHPIIYTQDYHSFNGGLKIEGITVEEVIKSYNNTLEGHHIQVPHCLGFDDINSQIFLDKKYKDGVNFVNEIEKLVDQYKYSYVLQKDHFSADYDELLTKICGSVNIMSLESVKRFKTPREDNPLESIEIIGLCTDICVVSNAFILRNIFPEVEIYVDPTCCAGSTPEKHDVALKVLESCCFNINNIYG